MSNIKKIYYLSTCTTCKKIMDELNLQNFEMQDIKSDPITKKQLDDMRALAGSYEALFSKRAQLYKEKGLKDKELTENDFQNYILEHYTFLKRPVIIDGSNIYIGSSPKTKKSLLEKYGNN